jgi:hypothetical protein
MKAFTYILTLIILGSAFGSCATIGRVIEPNAWVGALDLAAALGIGIFIFRGSKK